MFTLCKLVKFQKPFAFHLMAIKLEYIPSAEKSVFGKNGEEPRRFCIGDLHASIFYTDFCYTRVIVSSTKSPIFCFQVLSM